MSGGVMQCHVDSPTMEADDATRRLEEAMNTQRLDLRLKWNEIARRAGISTETLFRFRKGARSDEATRAVEQALGWARGSVDAILSGGEPTRDDDDNQQDTREDRGEFDELREIAAKARALAEESFEYASQLEERLDRLGQSGEGRAAR